MNLDFVVALEKRATLFSYSRSVKHIIHFYLLRDFDIGMHYLSGFETHCNSNKKNLWSTLPSFISSHSV